MKQYLNDYYYELEKLDMCTKQENSHERAIDSHSFFSNLFRPVLLWSHAFYPISNANGLETRKSLLNIQRDEMMEQIKSLTKSKKLVLLSPLSYAVVKKDEKEVTKLANSHNLNYKDDLGNTALHYAAKHKHFAIMKILIDKGGDLSIENNNYKTPLNLVSLENQEQVRAFVYERARVVYKAIGFLSYEICLNIIEYEYGVKLLLQNQEIQLLGEENIMG